MSFALLLVVSWCVMVTVHEAGHVLFGWAAGGTLVHADIAPWSLPHSTFDPDPSPLLTAWGGPLFGVLAPLAVALVLRRDWVRFVAAFCVLANGCYLALAWAADEPQRDTARLLRHGARPAAVAAYCVVTIGVGYAWFRRACRRVLLGRDAT